MLLVKHINNCCNWTEFDSIVKNHHQYQYQYKFKLKVLNKNKFDIMSCCFDYCNQVSWILIVILRHDCLDLVKYGQFENQHQKLSNFPTSTDLIVLKQCFKYGVDETDFVAR